LYFVGLHFGNDLQPAVFDYAVLESANGLHKGERGHLDGEQKLTQPQRSPTTSATHGKNARVSLELVSRVIQALEE